MSAKTDWTVAIYKRDRRCKTGERLFSTTVWANRDEAGMRRECNELYDLYPATKGWRFDVQERYATVRNLMTGKDVKIEADTPWCCNPASETYWSM